MEVLVSTSKEGLNMKAQISHMAAKMLMVDDYNSEGVLNAEECANLSYQELMEPDADPFLLDRLEIVYSREEGKFYLTT